MKTRDRLDREVGMVNRVVARYQRLVGQEIQWYEWDSADSTVDTVYDEGGERTWRAPKTIRVIWIIRREGVEIPNERGFYVTDSIHFLFSVAQVTADGLSDPLSAAQHEKDRIVWDGDVWDIREYHVEGRIGTKTVTIGVDAVQVKPDEYANDPQFGSLPYGDFGSGSLGNGTFGSVRGS